MQSIQEILAVRPLLFDGGMGTYYKAKPGAECELANLTDPEGVRAVHREYRAAGAQALKTNTFGVTRMAASAAPWRDIVRPARKAEGHSLTFGLFLWAGRLSEL